MYGTTARIRIQAGREEEALALLRGWEREPRPRARVTHKIKRGKYKHWFSLSRDGMGSLTPAVIP